MVKLWIFAVQFFNDYLSVFPAGLWCLHSECHPLTYPWKCILSMTKIPDSLSVHSFTNNPSDTVSHRNANRTFDLWTCGADRWVSCEQPAVGIIICFVHTAIYKHVPWCNKYILRSAIRLKNCQTWPITMPAHYPSRDCLALWATSFEYQFKQCSSNMYMYQCNISRCSKFNQISIKGNVQSCIFSL